jgi:hypothetical protein
MKRNHVASLPNFPTQPRLTTLRRRLQIRSTEHSPTSQLPISQRMDHIIHEASIYPTSTRFLTDFK